MRMGPRVIATAPRTDIAPPLRRWGAFVVPGFYRGVMSRPGDHIPRPDLGPHAFSIAAPHACPTGHPLRPPFMSVDYLHCGCREVGGGHLGWYCWVCGWEILAADHLGENPVPPPPDFEPFNWVRRELAWRQRAAPPSE